MMRRTRYPLAAATVLAIGGAVIARPSSAQGPGQPYHGAPPAVSPGMLPVPPTGPAPQHHAGHAPGCTDCTRGPIGRAVHHVLFTLKDKFIGYPDQFAEPPLGFYLNENLNTMKAKADPHEFFLYQSDFIREGTTLSPTGAQRLSLIVNRLDCWLGPIVVEWTPEQPELAEARKALVLSAMTNAGIGIDPDRILIGPSPYPGLIGDIAERYYPVLIERSTMAPAMYSLPPQSSVNATGGAAGSGGRGGAGGGQ